MFATCSEPVERLKLVVAFVVGGMRQQVSCDKPFNPILVSICFRMGGVAVRTQRHHNRPNSKMVYISLG